MKNNGEKKSEKSLYELQDIMHRNNLCIVVPSKEEWVKGAESLFEEITPENFPNLGRDLDIQVHETNRSPHAFNLKQSSPKHKITKLSKITDKERIFTEARENKFLTNKVTPIRLLTFSANTLQARRDWDDIIKVQKKKLQTRNTLRGKVVFQERR